MKKINKLTCSLCKKKKGITPDRVEKLLIKYKTEKALLETYECRDCKSNLKATSKAAKAPRAPRKQKKGVAYQTDAEGNRVYKPVQMIFTKPIPFDPLKNEAEYRRCYGTICANPPLFLDNRRCCNGCQYFDVCTCPHKIIRDQFTGRKVKSKKGN